MAYVSQEMKKDLTPAIKAVLNKYGVKGSISVRNHMSLVVKIKSGVVDFIENYIDTDQAQNHGNVMTAERIDHLRKDGYISVNTYWIDSHYSGVSKKFLTELHEAMKGPNFFNDDDVQTDYFHRSHYTDITIGDYNKPYTLTA